MCLKPRIHLQLEPLQKLKIDQDLNRIGYQKMTNFELFIKLYIEIIDILT